MLVNFNEMLSRAYKEKKAVGSFTDILPYTFLINIFYISLWHLTAIGLMMAVKK